MDAQQTALMLEAAIAASVERFCLTASDLRWVDLRLYHERRTDALAAAQARLVEQCVGRVGRRRRR
jgi:hypothetical protein